MQFFANLTVLAHLLCAGAVGAQASGVKAGVFRTNVPFWYAGASQQSEILFAEQQRLPITP